MVKKADPDKARAISGLPLGEEAIRNLAALPLRMLAGTLGIFEAVLYKASDTLREVDPRAERLVKLERRVDSLEEEQTTSRRESARSTSAARTSAPAASAAAEPERGASRDPAPG